MSARSAWPSSNASHRATATPSPRTSQLVDASATQLGTRPSGMIRIALPSAKNSVAVTASPTAGLGRRGRRNATAIAPRVDTEITANISQ